MQNFYQFGKVISYIDRIVLNILTETLEKILVQGYQIYFTAENLFQFFTNTRTPEQTRTLHLNNDVDITLVVLFATCHATEKPQLLDTVFIGRLLFISTQPIKNFLCSFHKSGI